MWLWEGSCNRKENAGAHSARTVPGNTKLFMSYFCRMTEQERCAPGAAALPNAYRCTAFAGSSLHSLGPCSQKPGSGCAPVAQGDAPHGSPLHGRGGSGLPPSQSLKGRAFECSKALPAALWGTWHVSIDNGDKHENNFKTVNPLIQHSTLTAKCKV